MSFEEYRAKVLKLGPKEFNIKRSVWVKDMYRWCIKNKLINHDVTEAEFKLIVRTVNKDIVEKVTDGHTVALPAHMGKLGLTKTIAKAVIKDGKVHNVYRIDWDKTLKLWYEDKEAEKNKTLVRFETKDKYSFQYFKKYALYNNKMYFEFIPARSARVLLGKKLNDVNNNIDAVLKY